MEIGISQHSPSFSSTLLDSIYRSIDQGEDEMAIYREAMTMRKNKQSYSNTTGVLKSEEELANFRRACMVEKWMEKKVKSPADLQTKKPRKSDRPENFSWSSSDSSGGGFFSSSEAESFPLPRPKPVRVGGSGMEKVKLGQNHCGPEMDRRGRRGSAGELDLKPKDEGGFLKTKSRALRIYGDLKKVKQPISPGGKLAGFLNSLFTKPKTTSHGGDYSPSLKSTNASTCSSASSFSRSCLSKTPSSRGKSSNDVKRSVKFSPVSVIVNEDRGHKTLRQNNTNKHVPASKPEAKSIRNVIDDNELRVHIMEKSRRVEVAAKDMLRNYQLKTQGSGCESEFSIDHLKKPDVKSRSIDQGFDYEDDDDDAASYASSDLFELDNLSAIGMDQRYREELPVYESTQLHRTNQAIANAMIF